MRTLMIVSLLLLLGCMQTGNTQDSQDAVVVDPEHHWVVFENEHVQVIKALASPGATSPMHTHPGGGVVISLDYARTALRMPDGTTGFGSLSPGTVTWVGDKVEHAWTVLSGQGHVIAVGIKSATRGDAVDAAPLPDTDAVVVDPAHHKVILENDHVRVFRAMASPGDTSSMHTHPQMVLVSLSTARLELTPAGSEPVIVDFLPGQVFWIDGTEHSWKLLTGPAHIIAVEVKAARN